MRNQTKSNNRRRPAWVEMFAKTRGGDDAADGRDWHTDVPNIKLSRAFVVVLVLHVVAVGGILAFEMFKPEGDALGAEKRGKVERSPALTADTPAAPAPERETETPATRRDSQRGGYESYIVQAGDSIRAVAERYEISRTELLTANRIDEQHPLVAGRLLRIPKALLPGGTSANLQHVSAETSTRPGTPDLASSIEPEPETETIAETETETEAETEAEVATVLPVPEPIEIAEENDGFQPIPTPPVSLTPTPASEVEPVASYQPAVVNASEENAPVTIVAPRASTKPKVTRTVPRAAPVSEPAAATSRSHSVTAGETLYGISRNYGVSVDAILAANPGVKPSSLAIGKTLRIP